MDAALHLIGCTLGCSAYSGADIIYEPQVVLNFVGYAATQKIIYMYKCTIQESKCLCFFWDWHWGGYIK